MKSFILSLLIFVGVMCSLILPKTVQAYSPYPIPETVMRELCYATGGIWVIKNSVGTGGYCWYPRDEP